MAWISYWLVFSSTIFASVFSIWKGDKALRLGGILRIGVLLISIPLQMFARHGGASYSQWLSNYDIPVSFFTALCFLLIAFKYSNLWLGAAMLIQGSELYIDSLHIDGAVGAAHDYTTWENLISTGIAACLFLGAVSAIIERNRRSGSHRPPSSPLAPPPPGLQPTH